MTPSYEEIVVTTKHTLKSRYTSNTTNPAGCCTRGGEVDELFVVSFFTQQCILFGHMHCILFGNTHKPCIYYIVMHTTS